MTSSPEPRGSITTSSVDEVAELNGHQGQSDDSDLSYEERASFAGVDPNENDDALVTTEELLAPPSSAKVRGKENSPMPRTTLVASGLGVVALFVWLISSVFTGGDRSAQTQEDPAIPEETTSPYGEDDRYRAELALIEQERRQAEPRIVEAPERLPPERSDGPPPEPSPEPPQPTRAQSPAPPPAPPPTPPRPPEPEPLEPEIDPLEQWAQLSGAGATGAEVALAPAPEFPQGTGPTEQAGQVEQAGQQEEEAPAGSSLPSATVGDNPVPLPGLQRTSQVIERSPQQPASAPVVQTISYDPSPGLSPGAEGILRRQPMSNPQQYIQQPAIKQVPVGSWAEGEIKVPVVYADGAGPTRGRAAVELTSPLLDTSGEVALPEGTILITEITEVLEPSILRQEVVAVVYEDANGDVRQEEIESGVLLIRGKENGPLVADVREDGGSSFRDDLLVGALSALGNVGRVINAPDSVTTATSGASGGRTSTSTSTTVTSGSDEDALAAALEGFFTPVAQRVSERTRQRNNNRTGPYLLVEEGEEVSVFVNGLLEVAL